MKMKKIVSAFAALAMAASAFAGLTAQASTTTALAKVTYEDAESTGFSDLGRGATSLKAAGSDSTNTTAFVEMHNGGGTKGSVRWNVSSGLSANAAGAIVSFDFLATGNTTYTKYVAVGTSSLARIDLDSVTGTNAANAIFTIGNYSAGNYAINGSTATSITPNTWVHVSALVDFNNKQTKVQVSSFGSTDGALYTGTVPFLDDSVSTISGVSLNSYRGVTDEALYFDNFEILECSAPVVVLTEPDEAQDGAVSVGVGSQINIDTTGSVGTLTASSSAEETASVAVEGSNVVITGVQEGLATITVTATTEEGLSISKNIVVTVGDVETRDVTINYYVAESTEAVPVPSDAPKTIEQVAVGSEIKLSDLYTDTVTNETAKYTFNAAKTTDVTEDVSYIVKDAETQAINVYFDKHNAVTSVTIKYTAGDQEVKYITEPLSGFYEDDSYTYYSNNYIKAEDGTYYAVGAQYTEDVDSRTLDGGNGNPPINVEIEKTVDLSQNAVISYNVNDTNGNIVYYEEAETIYGVGASTFRSRYSASGGKTAYTTTTGKEFYTVDHSGLYQILLVGTGNNRGTAIYASLEDAQSASGYAPEEGDTKLLGIKYNNTAYGVYTVKTVALERGTTLAIRGFGSSNATDNTDYIVIRDLSPEVDLTNVQAEFRKDSDTEASMRFLASPTYDEGTVSSYGFWFVNIDNMTATGKVAEGSEDFSSGDTFHYTFDKTIDITGATAETTVNFYAVPWVVIDGATVSGTPFTYDGTVGETTGNVQIGTKTYK